MALPIISADERLAQRKGIKGCIFGRSGIGKTSLLWTLNASTTLFMDLEAGDLAVEGWDGDTLRPRTWKECRDFAVFIGGPNPALRDDQPYSQAHFDEVCSRYGEPAAIEKYDTVFIDSITVAGRLCFQWCRGQPEATSEKTGKPDIRGAYGLHGREMIAWLTHLQHTRGKHVWFVGILDERLDDFGRKVFQAQIDGSKTGLELPGIVDQVITMADIPDPGGQPQRAFVCQTLNPWGYPAKDRSGRLDMVEAPHLGRLMEKIQRPARPAAEQGLVTAGGKNLFAGRFTYLNTIGLSAAQVFDETLAILFNAAGGGALHVENLKGATGEIALRVGDNEPFGVINVGDDAKLVKLCEDNGIDTQESEFAGSLFHAINTPQSTVNLLIGSKKFTEGWNSWRVSTMGLMNVGQTEGSQIIQLFGRGVRLKGYCLSLKRSGKTQLPDDIMRPKHIGVLETLSIFGIRANYMAQFRDFLEEEGLPVNDDRVEFMLPIIKNLGTQKLKTIRLKKTINGVSTEFGDAFRRLGPIPTLAKPDPAMDEATAYLQKNQVVLNWYPKIQAMKSRGVIGGDLEAAPNQAHLTAKHIAFLDIDRLYFEAKRFKAERGWYNLNLTSEGLAGLLEDQSWYQILIPAEELAFDSFEKVRLWGEIALSLLKKYTERYYTFRKREWELPHLEYQELAADDPNFPKGKDEDSEGYYRILLDQSREEIVAKLTELKTLIEGGTLRPWEFSGMKAIWFGRHLYEPLLYLDQTIIEVSPVALNKGERNLVEDVKAFHDGTPEFFADKELYLLRNLSKGRGVGFFEAGNFHPDFVLWLIVGDRQCITFIDPKGIRNLGFNDPKIQFFETIKDIERRLGDPSVTLSSFIISNTPSHTMRLLWAVENGDMNSRNILFQEEDKASYVRDMLVRSAPSERSASR